MCIFCILDPDEVKELESFKRFLQKQKDGSSYQTETPPSGKS